MDWNFGGLEDRLTHSAQAAFGVIPVPFEETTSYGKGACRGPAAIVEASRYLELFDEVYGFEPAEHGIWTAPPFDFPGETLEEKIHLIYAKSADLLGTPPFLIFLGGEHSITFPIVRAYRERFDDLTVLQIDAHADLRVEYEGSRYSHAAVMRQVVGLCPAVQVGIRSMSVEEYRDLPGLPTTMIFAHDLHRNRAAAIEKLLANLSENVYITVDLDGFDPALVPATGTPEPGGLFWQDSMDILESVFARKSVVGCDVVELSPITGFHASDFLAAKLVYKLMAMKSFFSSQKNTHGG